MFNVKVYVLLQFTNKTVLLRERKRHTDRGVSSTPSVVLYWGVPHLRYPPSDLAGGTPSLPGGTLPWVPPGWTWHGYPRVWTWPGYPLPGPGWGTPILWTDRRTDTCQNITFPHTTYVVGNNKKVLHERKKSTAPPPDRTWDRTSDRTGEYPSQTGPMTGRGGTNPPSPQPPPPPVDGQTSVKALPSRILRNADGNHANLHCNTKP